MKRRIQRCFIKMERLTLIMMFIGFVGCSTEHTARRGSLGDVMEKTSNGYEGERVVEVEREKPNRGHEHHGQHHQGKDDYIDGQIHGSDVPPFMIESYDTDDGNQDASFWYFGVSGSYVYSRLHLKNLQAI